MAPAPCNYLLKTLEDKRKKKLSTLAQEQPSLQGTGEQLRLTVGSAVPPEPGSLQRPGLQVPWTGRGQGLSEEKPFHGCVQDKAERRRAVCLGNAALPWHLLSPLTAEPTPHKCSSGPDPTEWATAGRGRWAPGYSFRPGASETLFPDPAGTAHTAQPLIMDHSPSQPSGLFISSFSWLCSSFSC